MNIIINKQTLLSALSFIQLVSEKSNTNSYYSFFILDANNDIILKSADRQNTFEQIIVKDENNGIDIKESGAVLLPSVKTFNIIQNLPDGLISFITKENDILIKPMDNPNDISFSIRTRSIEDYPNMHKTMPQEAHAIDITEFYTIINNTSFAASSDLRDPSLFLTGVFFETKENHLIAVATDRNRISISKMTVSFTFEKDDKNRDIIVPSKTIGVIKKLITEDDEEILIAIDDEKMYFKTKNILITTSLISGTYYDYSRIIPKKERNLVTVDKNVLKNSLNRVAVVDDIKREAIITFKTNKDHLFITSEKQEQGVASEKIPATIKGNDGEFSVKLQFLLDPLNVINTDDVNIEYGDEKRDLIKITSTEKDNTIHITAPFNA